jgi:hypothetical protein
MMKTTIMPFPIPNPVNNSKEIRLPDLPSEHQEEVHVLSALLVRHILQREALMILHLERTVVPRAHHLLLVPWTDCTTTNGLIDQVDSAPTAMLPILLH